ncbi:2-phospho-L-lactate guanylyltransferase [Leucobacter sp. Z1108]|uniref:2-phospho-L-lactate guanylyltransferase n=1 Tax=Leucobacter sp. Z1108 TaxID=3439066 RepID=UPI003F3C3C88
MEWNAVVAFRGELGSKSRLSQGDGAPPPEVSLEFARAFACDLVDALHGTEAIRRVTVLTKQPLRWSHRCAGDEELVMDRSTEFNAALSSAVVEVRSESPHSGVLILPGDLPALTPVDLAGALAQASRFERAFVTDRVGTGTTLLTARPGAGLMPLFGEGSARRHSAAGFHELDLPVRSPLRNDVDTLEDLERAMGMGVGSHTEAIYRRWFEMRTGHRQDFAQVALAR